MSCKQLFFGVQSARCEVVDGQVCMHAQVHDGQIRIARLRLLAIELHIAAYPSPGICLYERLSGKAKSLNVNTVEREPAGGRFVEYFSRVAEGAAVIVG